MVYVALVQALKGTQRLSELATGEIGKNVGFLVGMQYSKIVKK